VSSNTYIDMSSSPLYLNTTTHDEHAPWLLLIHGLFGDGDNLAVVKRHFAERYNIVSVDLPHHGRSAQSFSFSLREWALAIAQALVHQGIGEFSIVGHSLGGKVAMLMAQHSMLPVRHLVVVDIAPVAYNHRHQTVFTALANLDLMSLTSRQHADQQLSLRLTDLSTRQFLLKSLAKSEEGHYCWRFNLNGLMASYNLLSDWQEVSEPYMGNTWFIKGARSDYLVPDYQASIRRQFPNAKAHVIADAGHWLHAEKPQAFLRVLDNIL